MLQLETGKLVKDLDVHVWVDKEDPTRVHIALVEKKVFDN